LISSSARIGDRLGLRFERKGKEQDRDMKRKRTGTEKETGREK
jgi:hypothetical protein